MTKRILSMLLALCMVLTLVPAMASVEAAGNAGTSGAGVLRYTGSSPEIERGDKILFGSYPQTEIVDKASNSVTYGKAWESDNDYDVDAPLYSELRIASWDANDDTTIDGVKYHRLNGSDSSERYFRYDPIKWRVLEKNDADLFVFADIALDCMYYKKANNPSKLTTWEKSDIRSWLNNEFYNRAFSSAEQAFVKTTNVVNTDDVGNTTEDKMFLLSYDEVCGVKGESYGFHNSSNAYDTARRAKSSTYAKAEGAYTSDESNYLGNCEWWLRSPGGAGNDYVMTIIRWGQVRTLGGFVFGGQAVRPALHINLESNDQIAVNTKASYDVRLSKVKYVFDGNEHKPSVSIEGLTENVDYKVSYTDCINPGTATVTVTGIGDWEGTVTKTYTIESYRSETSGSVDVTVPSGTVTFGSYPQTEIVDNKYNSGACEKTWESDGDYVVDSTLYSRLQSADWDENGDTTIDGVKYYKLNRKDATYSTNNDGSYFSWGDLSERYFRYDPIQWRVLAKEGDDLFLLANIALDVQKYNNSRTAITWENSTIRSWLNGKFYNRAFSSAEQEFVKTTDVVNADGKYNGTDGGNDTKDKVFLLSEDEVYGARAPYYGFAYDRGEDDTRKVKSSTFAKAMGAYVSTHINADGWLGNCYWWLRSPGSSAKDAVMVKIDGGIYDVGGYVDEGNDAVLPALHVDLKSNNLISGVDSIGTSTVSFSRITLDQDEYLYSGKPITPKVTIEGLTEGKDFEVTYENNNQVGIGKVVVTGIGDFSGTLTKTFVIREHEHCICGGIVSTGDHSSHESVTYQVWDGSAENLAPKGITYTNNIAYVCLENNAELTNCIEVSGGKTLVICLNGKELKRQDITGGTDAQKKFIVKSGARLVICDCQGGGSINCGKSDGKGGAFYVENSSSLDIFGGKITGSSAEYGGAIAVTDISPNAQSKPSTMNIYGGEISGNTATKDGAAVYVGNNCTLNIYGAPVVENNKVGNKANNIYLTSGQKLSVKDMRSGASIGVTTESKDYPVVFTGAYDKDYSEYFHADIGGLHVSYNESKELVLAGNQYNVTLNTNGGTISSGNINNYTYGREVTLPTKESITYTGHTFQGWYRYSSFWGDPVTAISATDFGDKTFYAKWETCSYNVKLNPNGGTINSGNIEGYTYGEGATLPADITKRGNTFKGWYDNEEMSGEPVEVIGTNEVDDREYWAKWEIDTYSVKLNPNGGTINSGNIEDYTYGEGAVLPGDIIKKGNSFMGWYDNEELSGEPVELIDTNEVDNKEYWAKWETNTYSFTLNTNGGIINKNYYSYGQQTTLPTEENITFTGHIFKGWYDNKELTGEPVTEISATDLGDKTFYAKWDHTSDATTITTITKATTSTEGTIVETCRRCGETLSTKVIPKVSSIRLSATSYTYNGKKKTPAVKVTDAKGNTIPSGNYKVSYANGRKNVGRYKVTVTLKGKYEGRKVMSFNINPKGTSISKLSKSRKAFTVKWKKQSSKMAKSRITGYQIRYSTSSKMTGAKTKTVKGYKYTSKKITKLKAKKKYYVQVRTYKTVSGKNYYSSWSKVKSVKTK